MPRYGGRNLARLLSIIVFLLYPLTVNWGIGSIFPDQGFIAGPKLVVLVVTAVLGLVYLVIADTDSRILTLYRSVIALHWLYKIALAAIGAFLVSIVTATDTPWATVVFGIPSRMDGALMHLSSLVIFCALSQAVYVGAVDRFRALQMLGASSTAVALVALVQVLGVEFWPLVGLRGVTGGGASSTIGHPSFVSGFLAIVSAIFAHVAMVSARRVTAAIAMTAAGLFAFTASAAGGRAGVAGLGVALIVSVLLVARVRYPLVRSWRYITPVGGVLLSMALLSTSAVTPDGYIDAARGADRSWNHRLIAWRAASLALFDQPLAPHGPGAFQTELWKNVSQSDENELYTEFIPRRYVASARRTETALIYVDSDQRVQIVRMEFDKAHNYILDLWLGYGFAPMILTLLLVVSASILILRSHDELSHALFVGVVVYGVFGQAFFPILAVDPVVWALLALAWGGTRSRFKNRAQEGGIAGRAPGAIDA